MILILKKIDDALRIVATGDTFPRKEALKAAGFRWTSGEWVTSALADDDSGAWLEGLLERFPGEGWLLPEWLAPLVEEKATAAVMEAGM